MLQMVLKFFVVIFVFVFVCMGVAVGVPLHVDGEDFVLDGVVYRRAHVEQVRNGITIRHATGITRVEFRELEDDVLIALGIDPDDVMLQEARASSGISDVVPEADEANFPDTDRSIVIRALRQRMPSELTFRLRWGASALVHATRITRNLRRVEQDVDLERLRGPGMRERAEAMPRQQMESTEQRHEIGWIFVVDPDHTINEGIPTFSYLYPTGRRYWWRPLYTMDPWLVPSIRRGEIPVYAPWERFVRGTGHGIMGPLYLMQIGDLAWLPPVQRDAFYWTGVSLGILAFLAILYVLLFKARRRR